MGGGGPTGGREHIVKNNHVVRLEKGLGPCHECLPQTLRFAAAAAAAGGGSSSTTTTIAIAVGAAAMTRGGRDSGVV